MKRKPWNICQVFECRRPTKSGQLERNTSRRYCGLHHPKFLKSARKRLKPMQRSKEKIFADKVQRNPYSIPLVCVYREYKTTESKRFAFTTDSMCGQKAPRHLVHRDHPKHPTNQLEPLCPKHAKLYQQQLKDAAHALHLLDTLPGFFLDDIDALEELLEPPTDEQRTTLAALRAPRPSSSPSSSSAKLEALLMETAAAASQTHDEVFLERMIRLGRRE